MRSKILKAGDDVPHAMHLIYEELNNQAKAVYGLEVPFSLDPISNTSHHLEDLLRTIKMKLDEQGTGSFQSF